MTPVDAETGEILEHAEPAAGPEQLRLVGTGMDRYQGTKGYSVLREAQPLGMIEENREMTVDLLRMGHTLAIAIDAPKRMSVHEAEVLKGMLDRAIKSAKKIAEKLQ